MQAQQGELERLVASHQRRLYGFMRARVRDDAVAQDLVQETWADVAERFHTYDPQKGTFWAFTRTWANFVVMQHWSKRRTSIEMLDPGATDEEGGASDSWVEALPDGTGLPEERLSEAETFMELLTWSVSCPRAPHEVVTFELKLLGWRPQAIVSELSDLPLAKLEEKIEVDYAAVAPVPALRAVFHPLRQKLPRRVGDLLEDPRTRDVYRSVLDRVAGETTLRDYYRSSEDPEQSVTHWWDYVKRSVMSRAKEAGHGPVHEWLAQKKEPESGRAGEGPSRSRKKGTERGNPA